MFERIKGYYDKGLWSAGMVQQAVDKGLLTGEQYRSIVGQPAPGSGEVAADG